MTFKRKDYTGQKFNRLTIIRPTDQKKRGGILWECLCDCGKTIFKQPVYVANGSIKSCGCLRKQASKQLIDQINICRRGKGIVNIQRTTKAWEHDPKELNLDAFLEVYKVCSICREALLKTQFSRAKRFCDGYNDYCKACSSKQLDKHTCIRMAFTLSYAKTMGCIDCGEKDPIVLDYDHVRGEKIKSISYMSSQIYPIDLLLTEITKCDIRCANCHRRRTAIQFGWHQGKPSPNCKNQRQGERYHAKARFIRDYLRIHPCVDCGETDADVLEFDHVRGAKLYNISSMKQLTIEKIQAEIAKCEVRCVNCHRRKTIIQLGWYKSIDVPNLPELDLTKPLETYLPKNRWDGRKKKP